MAVESKRGCGYRKVGGTYIIGEKFDTMCDRLPFKLSTCPCCGEGYKPSRNFRKISPEKMLGGVHKSCKCIGFLSNCPICYPVEPTVSLNVGHYLEWIGVGFYKRPEDFLDEAIEQGISRRLKTGIPKDLIVGKSVIYLAHRDVAFAQKQNSKSRKIARIIKKPAIFAAFTVTRLEHICTVSERKWAEEEILSKNLSNIKKYIPKRIKQLINLFHKGVDLVAVPDNDPDHR